MLRLGGAVASHEAGRARIAATLADGTALARFRRCAAEQGGRLEALPPLPALLPLAHGGAAAYVQAIDAEAVGLAGVALGAGRTRKEDAIDPTAGICLDKKIGERVAPGEPFISYSAPRHGDTAAVRSDVERRLRGAYTFGPEPPPSRPLILEVIR
jgi:pyrimidine-nucleoside phosphorylase/thymidine phosphorylase